MNSIRNYPHQTRGSDVNSNASSEYHSKQLVNYITRWAKYSENPLPPHARAGTKAYVDNLIESIEKENHLQTKATVDALDNLQSKMGDLEGEVNVHTAGMGFVAGTRLQRTMLIVKHDYFQYLALNGQDYLPLASSLYSLGLSGIHDTTGACMFEGFEYDFGNYPADVRKAIAAAVNVTVKCRRGSDERIKNTAVDKAVAATIACDTSGYLPIRELVPAYVAYRACTAIYDGYPKTLYGVERCVAAALHALYEVYMLKKGKEDD